MEEYILNLITEYNYLTYLVVLVWTFIEGETIVIICGALASEGSLGINVELLALAAFTGTFFGDQLYYYIGRHYGRPLLARWPKLGKKIDWTFKVVEKNPTLFILSFRFVYGVRNIAPFVIGISGVGRLKYFILNFIAAMIWAHSFAWGGYFLGTFLKEWIGHNKWHVMLGFFALVFIILGARYLFNRYKNTPENTTEIAEIADGETIDTIQDKR